MSEPQSYIDALRTTPFIPEEMILVIFVGGRYGKAWKRRKRKTGPEIVIVEQGTGDLT